MAISLKTAGTWARMVTDGGTVAIPGTPAAGDRMFLFGSWKTYTITVADPANWNLISDFSDGADAAGNGTGSVHNAVWYRDWQSGDGNPTIDYSAAPTEGHWVIMLWTKAGGDTWATPAARTGAISAADPFSVTASATANIADASVVMGLIGLRDDSTTLARATTAIDDSGGLVTWSGNYVESPATHFNSTTGQDMSGDLGHRFVTTGATGVTLRMTGDPAAAESGAATWIIQALFTSNPQTVTPTTASLATTTFAPTVSVSDNQSVTPSTATLTTATFAPTVAVTDHQTVTPSTASLATATFEPTVTATANQTVTPGTASLALTSFEPTVTVAPAGVTVTPDAASLVLTAFAPSVGITDHQVVTPDVAALLLATFAPVVTASDHQSVTPTTASLTLTPFAPVVTAVDPQLVTPGTASLSLTTFIPTINAGTTVVTDVASLTLTTFAPTVSLTEHQLVTPDAASLTLATFAATIVNPESVIPATASLALTGFQPTVNIGSAGDVLVTPGVVALMLTGYLPSVFSAVPDPILVSTEHSQLGATSAMAVIGAASSLSLEVIVTSSVGIE